MITDNVNQVLELRKAIHRQSGTTSVMTLTKTLREKEAQLTDKEREYLKSISD